MLLLVKGMVIGFAIAAPVGPIGLLCIRRTLSGGRLAGFISGLGAAMADTVYGFVAAFGLTLVSDFLIEHVRAFSLVGGVFLLYVGIAEWRSRPLDPSAIPANDPLGLMGHFTSTFFLTLANPMTILSFVAILAGLGVVGAEGEVGGQERNYAGLTEIVVGVFVGSAGWWLILSGGVGYLRHRIGANALLWLNRIAGTLVVGFACYAFWQALRPAGF